MQLTFYRSSFRSNITNQLQYSWALARYILGVSAFRDFIHRFYLWIEYEPKNKGTCKLELSTMCCTIILRIDGDAKILLHRCAQMIHVTTVHLSLRLFYLYIRILYIRYTVYYFPLIWGYVFFFDIFFGGGGVEGVPNEHQFRQIPGVRRSRYLIPLLHLLQDYVCYICFFDNRL